MTTCVDGALGLADLTVEGQVRRVVVLVDTARSQAVALDATMCVEVARVDLP